MKAVAIIQARTSSTRMPGKVLQPLCGMPLIVFMLQRVGQGNRIDQVVVATSDDPSDDALAVCVEAHGFKCHRGSLEDVLSRFHSAAIAAGADLVVRLTGDCPLMDADLVDRVVSELISTGADYASNVAPPTYPDGLDVEAFTFASLDRAFREATLASEREHVTPFMRRPEGGFRSASIRGLADMSDLRWTIDYADDLKFVESLLREACVTSPAQGDRFDLYRALERQPDLLNINRHVRNEGYAKSLAEDRESAA